MHYRDIFNAHNKESLKVQKLIEIPLNTRTNIQTEH